MADKFLGAPYPIEKTFHGYLPVQANLDQIKSDLLILLLTNPGERPMLPTFGTPLRQLMFEPNTASLVETAKSMIINSIRTWEPRITVSAIDVSNSIDRSLLSPGDDFSEIENILLITISFFDPTDIQEVQQLTLEVPLGGS